MRVAALIAALLLAGPARAWDDHLDKTTAVVLISVPVGLLLWDGYIGYDRVHNQSDARTESMLLRDFSWRSSAVPFAAGAVAAHWFFNLKDSREQEHWKTGFAALGAVAALDIALALTHTAQDRPAWKHPAIWFGLGLGVGTFSWAQHF